MTAKEEVGLLLSRWKHRNGNTYTIIMFTNIPDEERYPLTVVYRGENQKMWSRRWSDWPRSMTPLIKVEE